MIEVAAIRSVIADVLEGSIGSRNSRLVGKFLRGTFEGQPTAAQQALSSMAPYRFDVVLGNRRDNAATYVSAQGSSSLVDYDVTIRITTRTATTAQDDDRALLLANLESDVDDAIQALTFAGNLLEDADGTETGIASGVMRAPAGERRPNHRVVSQDWKAQLITSEIVGHITLRVEANAA